ncbi:hypothetical protein TrVE_jg5640 [Triparma verrucosa]|uniref:Uncharacterized protein n=1 Tax=Triparma verrucosa TaxID=1606542 RepID=A0A9W7KT60_9STRA|nr:hypothetical protein TrVE_jg5640 [Triparma verrucosa]
MEPEPLSPVLPPPPTDGNAQNMDARSHHSHQSHYSQHSQSYIDEEHLPDHDDEASKASHYSHRTQQSHHTHHSQPPNPNPLSASFDPTPITVPRHPREKENMTPSYAAATPQASTFIRQSQASEQQFKRRFNALKKIYESRISHLTHSIQTTFNAVNSDPVLMAMAEDETTRGFVGRAVGDVVNGDLRDERERFIMQLANKLSASDATNQRLKQSRFELIEEVNSYRLRLTEAESTIKNISRDGDTINQLKEQLRLANEDASNARHEKTKVIDEYTTERVQLVSQIDKLKSFSDVVGKKDSEQLELIKELQADLNARAKLERERENHTFKLESQLESVKKDFSFESQRMKELQKELNEERERSSKYQNARNEIRNETRRLREENDSLRGKLEVSDADVQELRGKFAAVGEQMEVMLASEAKESSEVIRTLQEKGRALKDKIGEKTRAFKQVEKTLKLEISNGLEQLQAARRDTTIQIELNQRLTSELESARSREEATSATVESLRKEIMLHDNVGLMQTSSSADLAVTAKQQREHYNERLEDRVRSVQIETEAKTKELLMSNFEKKELEQQQKYQEMVTSMQSQYESLAEARKAEAEASIEKLRRFEAEYISRTEHAKEVELKVAAALNAEAAKNEKDLEVKLRTCRELCEKESDVVIGEMKEERKGMRREIESLEKQTEEMGESLASARADVEKQVRLQEKEKKSRQLLAEHLEEANMNMSRLTALLRKGEEEKNSLKGEVEAEKEKHKDQEEKDKLRDEALKESEREVTECEKVINDMKLKMKDSEVELEKAQSEASVLEEKLKAVEKEAQAAKDNLESTEEKLKAETDKVTDMKERENQIKLDAEEKIREGRKRVEDELEKVKKDASAAHDEARALEIKLVQAEAAQDKLKEKLAALEDAKNNLQKELDDRGIRLQRLDSDVGEIKGEENQLKMAVTRKQKAILSVQRLVDRKLVPLKHDLRNLKVSVGSDLESFGKDVYNIVKAVHEKWGEKNKVVTRRLSQHFDKELFNLRKNYEAEKQANVSDLIQEEVTKRETLGHEKDDEIRELNEELKELRLELQNKTEHLTGDKEKLHHELDQEKGRLNQEIEHLKGEKDMAEATIKMLRTKVERLEGEVGSLSLEKAQSTGAMDELKRGVDAFKGRLDMLVVCLENEFKFGEEIDEGLLSDGGSEGEAVFRASLRAMTEKWNVKFEQVKSDAEEPLERIIADNKEEIRRVVTELGATHETRIVAEERVKELESDLQRVESDLQGLRDEAGDLREKSVMVDDLERSRSEVAMFAELQRIEGESKERGLKGEIQEVKKKYEEKLRSMERKVGKANFEMEEKWRREVKSLREEKNELILAHEKEMSAERLKSREVDDKLHTKDLEHQKQVNALEARIMALQSELDKSHRVGVERDLFQLKENIDVMEKSAVHVTVRERDRGGEDSRIGDRLAQIENLAMELEQSVAEDKVEEEEGGGGGEEEEEDAKGDDDAEELF